MLADYVNAAFEACASLAILNHARAVWVSKQARGVSMVSTCFFTAWGFWNVYYYPHLGQRFSFYAGIAVLFAQGAWLGIIWYVRQYGVLNEQRDSTLSSQQVVPDICDR